MAWTERYVRADAAGGGNGTTDTNSGANGAWTLAEAVTNHSSGMRLNVRAGTYANTTTSRNFNAVGTTTAPIWWRGFNTTPGDIDSNNALTKPAITFSTGVLTVSGAHQIVSNLDISGAAATAQVVLSGGTVHVDRCRMECTNATANGFACTISTANGVVLSRSWLKATSTATKILNINVGASVLGCAFEGGGDGIDVSGAGTGCVCLGCVFNNVGGHGIENNLGQAMTISGCTFYSPGTDGIRITTLPAASLTFITNCIFSECGGYGINNATGTNTNLVMRIGNLFYSNTSGTETGFGDSPSLSEQTDTASPFVSAASGDLSLASSSNARNNGQPGGLENQSYTSYLDIGGVQMAQAYAIQIANVSIMARESSLVY